MTDNFEAIGRYHSAMRQARIALTLRDRAVGDLRELLSQVLAPGHAEFRVADVLLARVSERIGVAIAEDKTMAVGLALARHNAAASGEALPSVEDMTPARPVAVNEVVLAAPATVLMHDAARDLSGGN